MGQRNRIADEGVSLEQDMAPARPTRVRMGRVVLGWDHDGVKLSKVGSCPTNTSLRGGNPRIGGTQPGLGGHWYTELGVAIRGARAG